MLSTPHAVVIQHDTVSYLSDSRLYTGMFCSGPLHTSRVVLTGPVNEGWLDN